MFSAEFIIKFFSTIKLVLSGHSIRRPKIGFQDQLSLNAGHLPLRIVSVYDQEIPQSQTADNPIAPRGKPLNHHETPGKQIKQSNQLSLPHQDD